MNTDQIAAQMYTVRHLTKTSEGLKSTLEALAGFGYKGVQLSAVQAIDGDVPAVSATECRTWLDDLGLRCVATHRPWSRLRDNTAAEIDFHHTLGCAYIAIGGTGEFGKEPDDYRRFLAEASPIIEKLGAAGITFGVHNHAHEFLPREGGFAWDPLINEGPKALTFEIDVYWAWHAGVDPADLLTALKGRVPMIHVKDRMVTDSGPDYAPIGEGNMPWHRILPAAQEAGVQQFIVEQDECQRDSLDCLRSSFDWLARF